ncbi:hypothetical protein LEMLEM_LOCUS60 [Lemmus lemmus]
MSCIDFLSEVERAQHVCLITVLGEVICPILAWGPLVEYSVKLRCDRPSQIHLSSTQRDHSGCRTSEASSK